MGRVQTAVVANFGFGAPAALTSVGMWKVKKGVKMLVHVEASGGVDITASLQVSNTGLEVDTFTYSTPTAADTVTFTIVKTAPDGTTLTGTVGPVTIGTAPTAGSADAQVLAAWNANSFAVGVATAVGGATFVITSTTPGAPLNVTAAYTGTGTWAKVVTTAAWAATTAGNNLTAVTSSVIKANAYMDFPILLRAGLDNYLNLLASGGGQFTVQLHEADDALQDFAQNG